VLGALGARMYGTLDRLNTIDRPVILYEVCIPQDLYAMHVDESIEPLEKAVDTSQDGGDEKESHHGDPVTSVVHCACLDRGAPHTMTRYIVPTVPTVHLVHAQVVIAPQMHYGSHYVRCYIISSR